MGNRVNAEKWAEGIISKLPKVSFNKAEMQLRELAILGSIVYDNKGNWIPQLTN